MLERDTLSSNPWLSRPVSIFAACFRARLWLLLAAVSLMPATALAQVVGEPSKAFFYKVTSPKATVYMLGSIHVAPPSMYPLPREIEDAFKAAQTLNVEVDINHEGEDAPELANQAAELTKAFDAKDVSYPDGDDLWKHLDPTTAQKIRDWCVTYDCPSQMFEHARPWVVSMMIAMFSEMAIGMDGASGIDMHFLNEAARAKKSIGQFDKAAAPEKSDKSGKPIAQIESIEGHIKLLSSAPEDVQLSDLKQLVEGLDGLKPALQTILDAWLAGDETQMDSIANGVSTDPSTNKKIVEDRNLKMADFIEAELKAGTNAFVVVGAAHFVGDKGIVALLRSRGYTVTQEPVTWIHSVNLEEGSTTTGKSG